MISQPTGIEKKAFRDWFVDQEGLDRLLAGLNPYEVQSLVEKHGLDMGYTTGSLPSKWTMSSGNAGKYAKFLHDVRKLGQLGKGTMSVNIKDEFGNDVPVDVKRDAKGNILPANAAYTDLRMEQARLMGRLKWTPEAVDEAARRNAALADESWITKGQDVGAVSRHAKGSEYVNPMNAEAAMEAAYKGLSGKQAEEYIAGRLPAIKAETSRQLADVNSKIIAMRQSMPGMTKAVDKAFDTPSSGGTQAERWSFRLNNGDNGAGHLSAAERIDSLLAKPVAKAVYDSSRMAAKLSPLTWAAEKISPGLGKAFADKQAETASGLTEFGANVLTSPATAVAHATDWLMDSNAARTINKLEGRHFGNSKEVTRAMVDSATGKGTYGTGIAGHNIWQTLMSGPARFVAEAVPGVGVYGKALKVLPGGSKVVFSMPGVRNILNRAVATGVVADQLMPSSLDQQANINRAIKYEQGATRYTPGTVPDAGEQASYASAVGTLRDANRNLEKGFMEGKVNIKHLMSDQPVQQSQPQQPAPKPSAAPKPASGGSKSWYKNPWVWLAGAGTLLGGGMLVKNWMDSRRRRREEEEYSARMAAVDAMRRNRAAAMQARRVAPPMVPYDYRQEQPMTVGGWSGDDPFDFYTGDYYY